MSDEITPHAEPIPQTGEAEWFPPAADDNAMTTQVEPPHDLRWVFFGRDGFRAGWSLLVYIAIFLALAAGIFGLMIVTGVLHRSTPGAPRVTEAMPKGTLLGEGIQFAAAALAAWVMTFIEKRRFAQYGLGSPVGRMPQFAGGALLGFATLSALVGVLWSRHLVVFNGLTMRGGEIVEWGFVWAIGFLFVGLFEEYLTRGYLQFTLARGLAGIAGAMGLQERNRKALGFWLAALFFSFIFGFGHKANPGESPVGIVSAGLIGLVFAFSLWRTGSLWFAVGWHAAWDWAQSFVWSVPDSGTMMHHHLLYATPQGPVAWSGGSTGPEGSVFVLPTIAITFALFALLLKPQPGSPSAEFARGE